MDRKVTLKHYVPRAAVSLFFQYCKEATRSLQDVADEAQRAVPPAKKHTLH